MKKVALEVVLIKDYEKPIGRLSQNSTSMGEFGTYKCQMKLKMSKLVTYRTVGRKF